MENLKVRKIGAEELVKLKKLYKAKDNETFMKERKEKIQNKIQDIFVLEDNSEIIGEVTIKYKDEHNGFTIENKRVYMEALRILEAKQGED